MSNDEKNVRRGERAKVFLEDTIWTEAWTAFRDARIAIFEDDMAEDADVLKARLELEIAREVRGYLTRLIIDGKMSAAQIEMDKQRG